ncbi:unnamed protein product [Cylicocyclus nassatus]|uniref:SAP domain-containing protein n=1 Tax=Cylicocyclus nassatus TaxID=53992 RepID=A0AA36H5M1_CYLNA|nr:unnamed protein product [Cylicocyclus nassatus]
MSSRPRRSCARVDDSILSPSTIFLWSDARLRQELTRRGLSRVGIREDLIDRLLDSINGVISDKASEHNETASIASNVTPQQPSIDGRETTETPTVSQPSSDTSGSATKTRGKRKAPAKSGSASTSSRKRAKRTVVKEEPESPSSIAETPTARPRKQRSRRTAVAEEVPVPPGGAEVAAAEEQTNAEPAQVKTEVPEEVAEEANPPVEPAPTCSITQPILSILPKIRPLPCLIQAENAEVRASPGEVRERTEASSSQAATSDASIYTESSDDDSCILIRNRISSKRLSAGSDLSRKRDSPSEITSAHGAQSHARKLSHQKDEDDRHHARRPSSTSVSNRSEKLPTHKPITEAWAERLAQLKKSNPKFASGSSTSREKPKELETRKKSISNKHLSVTSTSGVTVLTSKKTSVVTTSVRESRPDLLDSIMTQQTEFLQTMRRPEDRNSPEIIREVRRLENDVVVDHAPAEKPEDMSLTALEAYKRFEQTCAGTSSVKNSPKSPQILLPPPPPPPKTQKKPAVAADTAHLLVPPPPPPPPPLPPQSSAKDIPPPPPPRRPKATSLEQLPPPPPPPKRLKPAHLIASTKQAHQQTAPAIAEVQRESPSPDVANRAEELAVMSDVKACLEYVVFLVSSIKPFDEISGELLPATEVPIPFSQRSNTRCTNADSQDHKSSITQAKDTGTISQGETSAGLGETVEEAAQQDDEEYDPLESSAVEGFESYVPSAVVTRNVTLDDLVSSQTPELDMNELPAEERYSPTTAQPASPMDEDEEEEEVIEDGDSDVLSLSDDSEEESEGETDRLSNQTFLRTDGSGNIIKVVRRTPKKVPVASETAANLADVPSANDATLPPAEENEVEMKPDPALLEDPRHLLQRASAVLQGLGKKQDSQYSQMPYDEEYEEEEVVQPMDSFHGEPVPDDDDLFEVAAGIKPKRKDEVVIIEEKVPVSTEEFEIDFYNGDLHLKGAPDNDWIIDPDNQDGLALVWGGVKSTHGIFRSCRQTDGTVDEGGSDENSVKSIVFQVKILDLLPTRHLPFDELDPNDIRVGFSLRSAPLVLGEYPGTYCFTSLGKKASNNLFTDYGEPFTVGDIVTAQMDFETKSIRYWKNNDSLGEAFTNITIPDDEAVYPHICVKNCRVTVNFGTFPGGEDEWIRRPEWVFPNAVPSSQTERAPVPPDSKSDCTVLMMVGLPSVGKTTWVRRYIREHPSEHWTLISSDTILASMKVNGVSRNSSHIGRWDMVLGLVGKARNRLLSLAARRRRNYILDFTNCDPDTRKKRLALFEGFFRQCVTIVPSDEVMQQRHARHLRQNRGEGTAAVPIETFLELKAVMEMPVVSEFLESVIYVDPAMEDAQIAIDRIAKFNEEGRPWYSSKYNKRRGYWSGTYGDEPYRKPSITTATSTSTTNRVQTTSAVGSSERTSTDANHSAVTTNVNISPVASAPDINKDQHSLVRPTTISDPARPVEISEKITNLSLETRASATAATTTPSALASSNNSGANLGLLTTASSPMFSVPPPTGPQTPLLVRKTSVTTPVLSQPPPPSASAERRTSFSLIQQAAPPPVVAQPPPITVIAPPPAPIGASSANHPSPITSQFPKYASPRNRWDAPPPAVPNFSIPPPSIPPPSLVLPNLYVPSIVPLQPPIIPLLPNTSVPPPQIAPTNLPPPGWQPRPK